MSRAIEIIDPEGERRQARQRWFLFLAVLASLALFGYPEAKDYLPKWQALRTGRKFALYLSQLKTDAILKRVAIEAKFQLPDQVDIYEVSSCGPYADRKKVSTMKLSDFGAEVEFAPEPWVRENTDSREPYLPRFCYDPLYGSSVYADGLAHGGIFLAHRLDVGAKRGDHLIQVSVEGVAGDLALE